MITPSITKCSFFCMYHIQMYFMRVHFTQFDHYENTVKNTLKRCIKMYLMVNIQRRIQDFHWGGGAKGYAPARTLRAHAEPNLLSAGKGPGSSRMVLMVPCAIRALYLSILEKKDTNHSCSIFLWGGGGGVCSPPPPPHHPVESAADIRAWPRHDVPSYVKWLRVFLVSHVFKIKQMVTVGRHWRHMWY